MSKKTARANARITPELAALLQAIAKKRKVKKAWLENSYLEECAERDRKLYKVKVPKDPHKK